MIRAFTYKSAKSVEQAVGSLADSWGKVEILAGGTDLLNLMKEDLAQPESVVNIKQIPKISEIASQFDGLHLGAGATLAQIAEHGMVRKSLPALAAAAGIIGGPQIRNMGTLGGNLCQRNRDWYMRNGLSPEVREETQYSAIFPMESPGGQQAIYVHPSTLAPALIAYGARVLVQGPKGPREIAVENFFQVSDGKNGRETVLAPQEIVTKVVVPIKAVASADYEVRERDSHDWPLVQASVALQMDGNKVVHASIILGHVGPLPLRAKAAETALANKELTEETATEAGKAAVANARPLGKNAYKVTLAQVAVKRALLAAAGNVYWKS